MNKNIANKNRGLVPRLRFPEFWDAGEWKVLPLSQLAKRSTQKNSDGNLNRVFTNSAEFGVVDQRDYFEKDIANQNNLEGYFIVEKGDYVYNPRISITAPVGPISKNNIATGVMSPLYTVFRFNSSHNDFYAHYFKTTGWHQYLRQASSTGARHDRMAITNNDFMAMPLPVTLPEEQQKIADCLTSLDKLITLEAQKLVALKTHKKGLMQQLFPAEGETVPKLRFPEFLDAGDWEEKTLGDIAKITSGGTPSRAKSDYWGGSIPWVTTSLVDFNIIKSTEEFITTEGLNNSSAKLFPAQTLLMAMYGQGKTRGKVALLGIDATTNQACAAIILNKDVDTNFVFQNLASRYDEIRKLSNEGGQENLSAGLIKEISLIYPGFFEQQKIAACLSSIDDLIAAQTQKIAALKTHKKGLMQQLFPVLDEMTE